MPGGVVCVSADMATFLESTPGIYGAIGVDVGGPDFDYEAVLDMPTCILLRQRLAESGRIAINIAHRVGRGELVGAVSLPGFGART